MHSVNTSCSNKLLILDNSISKQTLDDAKVRNQIEGKFGQAKRRFSLNRGMTKLANTSETAIAITFLQRFAPT
jgi:hypothetical protein